MAAFVYGVTLAILQRRVWRNYIVRVMIVAQFFNCARFVSREFMVNVPLETGLACRVVLFLNDCFSLLPVNLCVYCVVYLQLVVIHNVSLELRWPRVVALTLASVMSVGPTALSLIIPASVLGRESFCQYHLIQTSDEYAFSMYAYAAWAYVPGVIGLFSVLMIGVHIVRTRRATRRVLLESAVTYGPSMAVERVGQTNMLHRAIANIVWFPITPIVALWFNVLLITIHYYQQKTYASLRFINTILLCLQSVLLGLPLLVNPTMREALAAQLQKQRRAKYTAPSNTDDLSPQALLHPALPWEDTELDI